MVNGEWGMEQKNRKCPMSNGFYFDIGHSLFPAIGGIRHSFLPGKPKPAIFRTYYVRHTMRNFLSYVFMAGLLGLGAFIIAACTKHRAVTPAPVVATANGAQAVKKYLALGDSYTIGQSVTASERYPVQMVTSLRSAGINMADAEIIATTGWTTQDLWNAMNSKPLAPNYDLVTLLIGVNNQYQGKPISNYKTEFTTLLQRSIELAGNKADHVIVISVPDYSVTPFAASSDRATIARGIDSFNEANKQIAASFQVKYLNVTDESRKAAVDNSLIAADGLHFSGKEYTVWTSLLVPVAAQILH